MTKSRKSLLFVLVYPVVALLTLLVTPWWSLAVVSLVFGVAWRSVSPGLAFWPGLLVGASVFLVGAVFFGGAGASSLPDMLAELFGLGGRWALFAVVALVGGLVAGLSMMTGAYASATVLPARD